MMRRSSTGWAFAGAGLSLFARASSAHADPGPSTESDPAASTEESRPTATSAASSPPPSVTSLGPEVLLHIGKCCEPGYLVVVGHYDRFFASGPRDTFTIAAGLGFF